MVTRAATRTARPRRPAGEAAAGAADGSAADGCAAGGSAADGCASGGSAGARFGPGDAAGAGEAGDAARAGEAGGSGGGSPAAGDVRDTAAGAPDAVGARGRRRSALAAMLGPLVLDIAVPVGGFYLLRDGFGVSLVMSLALSSVVPALRTVVGALRERRFNGLAGLMVVVNVLSLASSFVTGDARLMVAKDSGITSVVGVCVLVAAVRGTPLMSTGMKPFLTRGRADRIAAWDRLTATNPRFHRLECRFSAAWGVVLIAECAARIVGAYSLPVATMVWLGNVIAAVAVGFGIVLGGAVATHPMELMLRHETRRPHAAHA